MEVLFENHVALTKEAAIEISKVATRKQRFFLLSVSIIYFLIPIIVFMLSGFDGGLLVMCAVFVIAFLILRNRIPKKVGAQLYKQQLILNNNEPLIKTTSVFENHMEHYLGNGSQLTVYYDRITSIKKTAHFMVLIYEKVVMVPIGISGFTKGTHEAFEAFLLEKGVKVK